MFVCVYTISMVVSKFMIGKISLGNVTTFESKLKQHYFTRNCHNDIFAWYSYGVKLLHCHNIASFLAPNQFFAAL